MTDDAVLDRYLSYDVATTALCAPCVRASIAASQQQYIYDLDVALARIGRSMSALGVLIDADERHRFAREYQQKADELHAQFVAAAGSNVNPRSYPQLKRLFYDELGLPILSEHLTDTGEPSTAEPVLLDLLARGVDDRARAIIQSLLGYREADKVLGTYTGRPNGSVLEGGLPCHADGRIRATWKYHGTPSGRSSSSPNLQNIPDKLRTMFVPGPGRVFVAADYSALELRILALLSGDQILINAFSAFDRGDGPDIHVVNACTLFGCTPAQVTKEVRVFAKRFVYGLSYGAGPPKIFQTMSLLRNDDLTPVFPGLTLSDVEHVYKAWWQAHPAIVEWRKRLISSWRRLGYIATPWHGRRRYFVGGENHEEMYNHPIQGAAGDLKNAAILRLANLYGFSYSRQVGLILDGHDQLVVECEEHEGPQVAEIVRASMEIEIGPMRFPAEAKIGRNWKEVS